VSCLARCGDGADLRRGVTGLPLVSDLTQLPPERRTPVDRSRPSRLGSSLIPPPVSAQTLNLITSVRLITGRHDMLYQPCGSPLRQDSPQYGLMVWTDLMTIGAW
jgi:hypothetical protein